MNEEQMKLLLEILSAQTPSISAPFLASGLGSRDVSRALSPEVLLAGGIVDPATLASGISSTEQQLIQQFLAETTPNITRPFESTPQYFAPILNKYGITPTEVGVGAARFSPTGTDEVSQWMADAMDAIASGGETAESIKNRFATEASTGAWKNVAGAANTLLPDLEAFEKSYNNYRDASYKFEYDRAAAESKALGSAVAPTRQQAMAEYYKSIGLPELALLGDPTATYQVPAGVFVDSKRFEPMLAEMRRLEGVTSRAQKEVAPAVAEARKQAEVYASRSNQEAARKLAEEMRMADIAKLPSSAGGLMGALISPTGRGVSGGILSGLEQVPFVGGLIGNVRNAQKGATSGTANEYYKRAMEQVMAESPVPTVSARNFVPESARLAREQSKTLEDRLRREQAYSQVLANVVSQRLADRGKTPFNDALQQLLGYAQTSK